MVNTFLPFPHVRNSLKALDNRRVQKQAVEAYQIYLILINEDVEDITSVKSKGFRNHPAVRMWRGYIMALRYYICEAVEETSTRLTKAGVPYKTTKMRENIRLHGIALTDEEQKSIIYPHWWGNPWVHASHQYKLYHKNPVHYVSFEDNAKLYGQYYQDYLWPSENGELYLKKTNKKTK